MLREIYPSDVKKYTKNELNVLCDEIRGDIYRTVQECGGHLSSNLGAVEASVALCAVFDFPKDKIVFDVGHQCYAYKLLTGRGEKFSTLRKKDGISGFPKRNESKYDFYDTGHAGTSVSAALGLAKARDLENGDYNVIAFIGDGSFNNGLIYEALTSLKILNTRILIILNDNGMSIDPTVGGMHEILTQIRENSRAENVRLLENFGLTYVGVKNGNDVEELVDTFTETKELLKTQSVLLHIHTKKGKGYGFSEEHPIDTHGVPPFGAKQEKEYSEILGETLCRLAKKNDKITVITAAMTETLGLKPFFEEYPERAFDVGICEENACVLASSLACGGRKPYYAIYSTFLQRAFDEIVLDVCMQDLPVVFCVDRAGISGSDGETHQGVFDLSYLSLIPNITILAPKDTAEFEKAIEFSETFSHPLVIRYPRSGRVVFSEKAEKIEYGKWETLQKGKSNVYVLAVGERCLTVAMKLHKKYENTLDFSVVNARFVKPFDASFLDGIEDGATLITLEDNQKIGGFGERIVSYFNDRKKKVNVYNFGYRDSFIPQGGVGELQREYGVSCEKIEKILQSAIK